MIIFFKGCLTNIEGIKYDSRWEDKTSVTEWDLYQNNPIYQDTLNSLPLYINKTQMQSTKYSLFQRTYIKIESEVRGKWKISNEKSCRKPKSNWHACKRSVVLYGCLFS